MFRHCKDGTISTLRNSQTLSKDDLCMAFLSGRHEYWFSELNAFYSESKEPKQRLIAALDFIIHMNEKEDFRGCSFPNTLSEKSKDQTSILSLIREHKKDLRFFFRNEHIADSTSDHISCFVYKSLKGSCLSQISQFINQKKLQIV